MMNTKCICAALKRPSSTPSVIAVPDEQSTVDPTVSRASFNTNTVPPSPPVILQNNQCHSEHKLTPSLFESTAIPSSNHCLTYRRIEFGPSRSSRPSRPSSPPFPADHSSQRNPCNPHSARNCGNMRKCCICRTCRSRIERSCCRLQSPLRSAKPPRKLVELGRTHSTRCGCNTCSW